jgi:DNA-binding NtrC family response regulator
MENKTVLVVDDEVSVRASLEKVLSKAGYSTLSAASGNEAIQVMKEEAIDIIVSDLKMPDGDGLELLRAAKQGRPSIEVILLTGYGTVERAVEAMKEGAYDFITKPFKKAVILSTVERAVERQNLRQENQYLKAQLGGSERYEEIIGKSQALREVMAMVDRVAPLVSTVLITGASGTGKEMIARALHRRSPRTDKRFVPINCAAIPEGLVESELFGHLKGSFTGALRDKAGLFKVAKGGTIFLDEIVSVPLSLQVKLLRAIEQKEILPVGSTNSEIIDVRIIAATNKNLAAEVEKGNFREDLYYRLNVVGINIPPLKERLDDIPELMKHFIVRYNAQLNKQILGYDDNVIRLFMEHDWKGNVRELENAIERAMILCDGEMLNVSHFPHLLSLKKTADGFDGDLKVSVRKFERETILRALEMSGQDKNRAADALGMSLSSLYRKLAELDIPLKE